MDYFFSCCPPPFHSYKLRSRAALTTLAATEFFFFVSLYLCPCTSMSFALEPLLFVPTSTINFYIMPKVKGMITCLFPALFYLFFPSYYFSYSYSCYSSYRYHSYYFNCCYYDNRIVLIFFISVFIIIICLTLVLRCPERSTAHKR